MIKRLAIYLREMYPPIPRLLVSVGLFGAVYLLVALEGGKPISGVGMPELVGAMTVFGFLLALRIVDEFKDATTDLVLGNATGGDLFGSAVALADVDGDGHAGLGQRKGH